MYRIDGILHMIVVVMLGIISVLGGEGATLNLSTTFGEIALTNSAAKFAVGVGIWFMLVGFYEYVTVVGEELWEGIKALRKK